MNKLYIQKLGCQLQSKIPVNAVFPIWSIVELPKKLIEYQNIKIVKSKFKNKKSNKTSIGDNGVLKENEKNH